MDRSQQYKDGYRRASKNAVEWLQQRAASMTDSHARDILNAAAFRLGVEAKAAWGSLGICQDKEIDDED